MAAVRRSCVRPRFPARPSGLGAVPRNERKLRPCSAASQFPRYALSYNTCARCCLACQVSLARFSSRRRLPQRGSGANYRDRRGPPLPLLFNSPQSRFLHTTCGFRPFHSFAHQLPASATSVKALFLHHPLPFLFITSRSSELARARTARHVGRYHLGFALCPARVLPY